MKKITQFLNPDELPKNPAFSNVAIVTGPHKTIYIGGQDAVNAQGEVIGKNDLGKQAIQILANLKSALGAAGASLNDLVKWNVYVLAGQNPEPAFRVFQQAMEDMTDPPLISMIFVAGLAHPDFLMEIDAVAVLQA